MFSQLASDLGFSSSARGAVDEEEPADFSLLSAAVEAWDCFSHSDSEAVAVVVVVVLVVVVPLGVVVERSSSLTRVEAVEADSPSEGDAETAFPSSPSTMVAVVAVLVVVVSSTLGGVVCLESEARPFAAWAYEKTGISGADFLAETEEAAMKIFFFLYNFFYCVFVVLREQEWWSKVCH